MDSLNHKILTFLSEAGCDVDPEAGTGVQLLRYFERTYGLHIMGMLEQEWIEEQIKNDVDEGCFSALRKHVPKQQQADYDRAVLTLLK